LNNEHQRNEVLKEAKRVKGLNNNIFINPDQTVAERHLAKQLMEESKKRNDARTVDDSKLFYFGIRENKV
jgi:hypothetical protein